MNINRILELSTFLTAEGFSKEAQQVNEVARLNNTNTLRGVMPDFAWLTSGSNFKAFAKKYPSIFSEFIELNSDTLAQFDISRFLGSGHFGDAWLLQDGTVLKIFHNEMLDTKANFSAADKYKNLMAEQANGKANQQDPMIYELGELEMPEIPKDTLLEFGRATTLNPSYVVLEKTHSISEMRSQYIQENKKKITDKKELQFYDLSDRLKNKILEKERKSSKPIPQSEYISEFIQHTLNEIIFKITDAIESDFYKYHKLSPGKPVYDYSKQEDLDEIVEIYSKFPYNPGAIPGVRPAEVLALEDMLGLKKDWSKKLTQIILRNIMAGRFDLHANNLGFRNDNPIFFDF